MYATVYNISKALQETKTRHKFLADFVSAFGGIFRKWRDYF